VFNNEESVIFLIKGLEALNATQGTTIPDSGKIINLSNVLHRMLREIRAEAEKLKEVPNAKARKEDEQAPKEEVSNG